MTVVRSGSWVQVHAAVLAPGERAPQVPADTQKVPLEMWVKGFLDEDAELGAEATVTTVTGRKVRGKLVAVNPAYTHGFGSEVPELRSIGCELKNFLAEGGKEGA